jgi:hypothetical protein
MDTGTQVFLMTKIDSRSKAGAAEQLNDSLRRLQTDRNSTCCNFTKSSAWMTPSAPLLRAALSKLLSPPAGWQNPLHGFTGHKDPSIHLHMLEVARKVRFSI